jgi:hypothetical protein
MKRIDDCEEAAEKAERRQSSAFTELEDRVRHTLEAVGKVPLALLALLVQMYNYRLAPWQDCGQGVLALLALRVQKYKY